MHHTHAHARTHTHTDQSLLDEKTQDDGVAHFSERLEDLGPQIWVLDHVIQLSVVVTKDACNHGNMNLATRLCPHIAL